MEAKSRPVSGVSSTDKNLRDRKPSLKTNSIKKETSETMKEEIPQHREHSKISMIPKLKSDKSENKGTSVKVKQTYCVSKPLSASKADIKFKEYEQKLKSLEAKEKSIAEYYKKMEDLIQGLMKSKDNQSSAKTSNSALHSSARKMTSDPLVFNQAKMKKELLVDCEKDVQQISDIWSKTSTDLSNSIKSLKNNPALDPAEFEVESVRIQLAVKQAKSLTLIKTRNVIAEAKKLMLHREMIRAKIEKVIGNEYLEGEKGKLKGGVNFLNDKRNSEVGSESNGNKEVKIGGTGDSEELREGIVKKGKDSENIKSLEEENQADLESSSQSHQSDTGPQDHLLEQIEFLKTELKKKNKTITQLNSKIFELQKACNEHTLKYNQLQVQLAENNENIQWNQILWKQIGKLKEKIKGLQLSNKNLQVHNKELESKITKLGQELDKLMSMSQFVNFRNSLISSSDSVVEETKKSNESIDLEDKSSLWNKILAEKQNVVHQLKTILDLMKNQENIAQKQIAVFQSKIEELERATNSNS